MMKREELKDKIEGLVDETFKDQPLEEERSFLPFSPYLGKIEPGQCVTMTAKPQLPFRGDRLVIWDKCASYFFINGLQVGARFMGVQAGDAPADAFATRLDMLSLVDAKFTKEGFITILASQKAEDMLGQKLTFPLCFPGTNIIMYITNVDDKPHRFASVIFGDIVHRRL